MEEDEGRPEMVIVWGFAALSGALVAGLICWMV